MKSAEAPLSFEARRAIGTLLKGEEEEIETLNVGDLVAAAPELGIGSDRLTVVEVYVVGTDDDANRRIQMVRVKKVDSDMFWDSGLGKWVLPGSESSQEKCFPTFFGAVWFRRYKTD